MKRTKIYGISGLMILLIIIPMINVIAVSSWPVQENDELNFSLSYQFYDENNIVIEDTYANLSVIIKEVDINITYDLFCEVNVKVGGWGSLLAEFLGDKNLTSNEEFVRLTSVIIYEASAFADMEDYWAELINIVKENFWIDALTFTTYTADEITNMEFSSSSDAYGYEITASWDDYRNLGAGSRSAELKFSKEGILLKFEQKIHWVEGGGSDWVLENTDANKIPSFPLEILGFCSILGIVVIFIKKVKMIK